MLNGVHSNKHQRVCQYMTLLRAVLMRLYCVMCEDCADVPAGLIVREGDDDELRVGNDGRPLLLPYVLERYRRHINWQCIHIHAKYIKVKILQVFHRDTRRQIHTQNMYVKSSGAE